MKIPRTEEPDGAIINISSLLDVMFILLIFFMATTTFEKERDKLERDRKVNLTRDTNKRTTLSTQRKTLVINVRSAHRNPDEGLYVVLGRQVDLKQIQKMVQDALQADADYKVLVRGDKLAYHGQVARAVSVCQEAGVKEANFAYMTSTDE